MIIAGVDPSTNTGISVIDFHAGTYTEIYANTITARGQSGVKRAIALGEATCKAVIEGASGNLDLVVIEGYGFMSNRLATLVEIGTMIRYCLIQSQIRYMEVAPSQLKKFATGKGNSKKDQIALNVYKKWGITCDNDNIADATVLAMIGGGVNALINMTAYQDEVATSVAANNI